MKRNPFVFVLAVSLVVAGGACAQDPRASSGSSSECTPLENSTANAPDQKPAFAGQTRAWAARSGDIFDVAVVAKGLNQAWAVEPLQGRITHFMWSLTSRTGNY